MSIARRRLMVYLVMIISGVFAVNLTRDIVRLSQADSRLAAARQELGAARAEQADLERRLAQASGDLAVESRIRNDLKMSKPDEVIAVIPEEVTTQVEQAVKGLKKVEEENNFSRWRRVFGF